MDQEKYGGRVEIRTLWGLVSFKLLLILIPTISMCQDCSYFRCNVVNYIMMKSMCDIF